MLSVRKAKARGILILFHYFLNFFFYIRIYKYNLFIYILILLHPRRTSIFMDRTKVDICSRMKIFIDKREDLSVRRVINKRT